LHGYLLRVVALLGLREEVRVHVHQDIQNFQVPEIGGYVHRSPSVGPSRQIEIERHAGIRVVAVDSTCPLDCMLLVLADGEMQWPEMVLVECIAIGAEGDENASDLVSRYGTLVEVEHGDVKGRVSVEVSEVGDVR
jgi:hypothetical protein